MGSHPINLAVRFLLEMIALLAIGYWGWHQGQGFVAFLLAGGLPLLAAILWGVFAVPDDPSRSGKAPVPVPGLIRLFLELTFFTLAVWCWLATGLTVIGWVMASGVIGHYALSYDRILWLIHQK